MSHSRQGINNGEKNFNYRENPDNRKFATNFGATEILPHVFDSRLLTNTNRLEFRQENNTDDIQQDKRLVIIDYLMIPFLMLFIAFFWIFLPLIFYVPFYDLIMVYSIISIIFIFRQKSIYNSYGLYQAGEKINVKTRVSNIIYKFDIPFILLNMLLLIIFFYQIAKELLFALGFALIIILLILKPEIFGFFIAEFISAVRNIKQRVKMYYWKFRGFFYLKFKRKDFLLKCHNCKAEIGLGQPYCEKCGIAIKTCSICKLQIKKHELIIQCPNCLYWSHKSHFNEWFTIHKNCPVCKKHLVNIPPESTIMSV